VIEETPTNVTSAQATGTSRLDRKQTKLLPGLIGAMVALTGVAIYVWMNRGVPDSYNPPPVVPKTSMEVEQQITKMRTEKDIPEGQRQMVLGLLQGELEKAKQREAKMAGKK